MSSPGSAKDQGEKKDSQRTAKSDFPTDLAVSPHNSTQTGHEVPGQRSSAQQHQGEAAENNQVLKVEINFF